MDIDPLAIRNLLIWIALALASTILLGGVPSWIRSAAKRADLPRRLRCLRCF